MSIWLSDDGRWGVEIVGDVMNVWQWIDGAWFHRASVSHPSQLERIIDLSKLDEYTPDNLINVALANR
jgi:hypothetical protein